VEQFDDFLAIPQRKNDGVVKWLSTFFLTEDLFIISYK
jgi:hypothetical protein